METDGSSLIIRVKDQGDGFDFDNLPDPTREENMERTSGRGIFLVKKLMDEVKYSDNGSQVKMVKHFK